MLLLLWLTSALTVEYKWNTVEWIFKLMLWGLTWTKLFFLIRQWKQWILIDWKVWTADIQVWEDSQALLKMRKLSFLALPVHCYFVKCRFFCSFFLFIHNSDQWKLKFWMKIFRNVITVVICWQGKQQFLSCIKYVYYYWSLLIGQDFYRLGLACKLPCYAIPAIKSMSMHALNSLALDTIFFFQN